MRTFQLSDARSHEFWTIAVTENSVTVTYGQIGTAGQTLDRSFPTPEQAQVEADRLVEEKTRQGYVETSPRSAGSEIEAFERAIRADPFDIAGLSAFADFLAERDDPRGEFMQVQLALENESITKEERKRLQDHEMKLLEQHGADWVGTWAEHPDIDRSTDEWAAPKGWVPYRFTHGLLTAVEFGDLTVDVARQVIRSPQLRFVNELTVHGIAYEEGDFEAGPDTEGAGDEDAAQHVLVRWPQLRHLRVFRFGGCEPFDYDTDWNPYRSHTPGGLIADFAKQMPDVEELHIMAHFREETDRLVALAMPRLRVLLLYHGWNYPLEKLAQNSSLTALRGLYCHPHALEPGDEPYIRMPQLRAICRSPHLTGLTHLQLRLADFGDDGVAEIVASGILKRLKVLDLRHGLVTDEGARTLAACPELKYLDHVDLSWNRIGDSGTAALSAIGVKVTLNRQQSGTDDWNIFGHGDIE